MKSNLEHYPGWRVRQRFRNSELKFECLVPQFGREAALREAPALHRLDRWLPEHRRVIPGDTEAITAHSFLQTESSLAYHGRWEEFFWQDEPFAFHLRSVGRHGARIESDHAELRRLIERYKTGAEKTGPRTSGSSE